MGLSNKLRTSFVMAIISALSFAGHYEAGISSGLTATASPGTVNGPVYGNGTASASAAFGNATGSSSVSGTISTTFTWIDDEFDQPAPASAIVIQTCNASASARSPVGGSPTASAANGLPTALCVNTSSIGFPIFTGIPFPPYTIMIGLGSDASSIGSAAKIVTGANSIQVTCTVSAAAASSVNVYGCSVEYSVKVFPITVQVNGTVIRKGNNLTLPGKKLQAFLNTGGADVEKVSGTSNWTIPGSIFDSFYVSPSQNVGHQVPVPASTFTASAPQWCFDDAASSNIVGTASFTYNGIPIGMGTGKYQLICKKPTSKLFYELDGSGVVNSDGIFSAPWDSNNNVLNPAILIKHKVNVDPIFSVGGSLGEVSICQICSLNRVVNRYLPPSNYGAQTNGSLDAGFPYDGWKPAFNLSSIAVNPNDDSPMQGFIANSFSHHVTVQDQFDDSLIFKAPGISEPVSVRTGGWVWAADANYTSGQWMQSFNLISYGTSTESAIQPQWTTIYTGN